MQVKKSGDNCKILCIKNGHIGIVEKAQKTSLDTVCLCHYYLLYFMNSGRILEWREIPTSKVTIWIPIAVPSYTYSSLANSYCLQVIKKGHIGIVEKVQETSSDTGMHNRAITVLHEL